MMRRLLIKPGIRRRTAVVLAAALGGVAHAANPYLESWPDTDFSRHTIELSSVQSGGLPKDGIPAIRAPAFAAVDEIDWLAADEPVIALTISGDARAYPLQVMIYHEIVNDTVGGVPVAVTFCPLCNAAMVFERKVGDKTLTFGVTGLLRNNDLVMYDHRSESWWQQFTGEGIVGRYAGVELKQRNAQIVAFEDFTEAFPGGRVLTRDTGYSRPYGRNPYRGYDSVDSRPFFPVENNDDARLAPMERVLNVVVKDKRRTYPLSVFREEPLINDRVNDVPVVVFGRDNVRSAQDAGTIADARIIPAAAAFDRRVDDTVLTFVVRDGRVIDRQTGSRWDIFGRAVDGPLDGRQLEQVDVGVHFAFAWLAFYPDTEIYRGSSRMGPVD